MKRSKGEKTSFPERTRGDYSMGRGSPVLLAGSVRWSDSGSIYA